MKVVVLNEIRKGFYLDSVALMRLSREVAACPGVIEAALMMGTPSNAAIMRNAGLLNEGAAVKGNDLVIAVKADTEPAARDALDGAIKSLEKPKSQGEASAAWRPHSISAAVKVRPEINLALISVPGDFAAAEARKALNRGLHVLMFSDNVSLEDELSLKLQARDAGLLMMGPDCGTAVIGGAPLAFANRLRRGKIGIIGASGTGTQEVSCLVSEAGEGISHAIGVGGRDLKKDIGGITTLMAIDAFDSDPETDHVVLISKPPHPDVATTVLKRIGQSRKSFTVCFIGASDMTVPANARFSPTLKGAAELALGGKPIGAEFDPGAVASRVARRPAGGGIEGLFAGGTLCAEAQVILTAAGREVTSNAAIPGVKTLCAGRDPGRDRLIDLGDDEYTRGRPHPMIDPSVRDDALRAALRNPALSVILLDLVLGYGAHADPAEHLTRLVADRGQDAPMLIASVVGTEQDPQVRSAQVRKLELAGIVVAPSNAQACELAVAIANTAGR
ncbi:acyl-CoA synthetase FdrA [Bradyrhizobium jicamae]|uniref:Acyl-CoA synthetase FdrA n=1 Tax=Bradyrhizobium jicamae TaxID=280332 RepID=A0ABS5FEX2_9BRAD|nr:acyl-CoA synthetase FdrA [Bradyrhizobium jicamae]MBR0795328.1 acyl-CoA synthetase FdrA [Bradyrhizobium jicamae]